MKRYIQHEINERYFAAHPEVKRPTHYFQEDRVLKETPGANHDLIGIAEEIAESELFSAILGDPTIDNGWMRLRDDQHQLSYLFAVIQKNAFVDFPDRLTDADTKVVFGQYVARRRANRAVWDIKVPRGDTRYGRFRAGCIVRSPDRFEWNVFGAELSKPAPSGDDRFIAWNRLAWDIDAEWMFDDDKNKHLHIFLPDEPDWKVRGGSDFFMPDRVTSTHTRGTRL